MGDLEKLLHLIESSWNSLLSQTVKVEAEWGTVFMARLYPVLGHQRRRLPLGGLGFRTEHDDLEVPFSPV